MPLKHYLIITDIGIEKNKDFNLRNDDVQRVKYAVLGRCGKTPTTTIIGHETSAACCEKLTEGKATPNEDQVQMFLHGGICNRFIARCGQFSVSG